MEHETYTLAPSVVVEKARQLASHGLHKQALDLLERNHLEVDVYPTRVEMRLPREMECRAQRERMLGNQRGVKTRAKLRMKNR